VASTLTHASHHYCTSLRSAKFLVVAKGDTPLSTRLWDAIDCGAIPVFTDAEQFQRLPFRSRVPWEELGLRVSISSNVTETALALEQVMSTPLAKLKRIRNYLSVYHASASWLAPRSLVFEQYLLSVSEIARTRILSQAANASLITLSPLDVQSMVGLPFRP